MTAKTGSLLTRKSDEPTVWRCLTCEYEVESVTLPYRCPRCGASRVKFIEAKGGGGEGAEEA